MMGKFEPSGRRKSRCEVNIGFYSLTLSFLDEIRPNLYLTKFEVVGRARTPPADGTVADASPGAYILATNRPAAPGYGRFRRRWDWRRRVRCSIIMVDLEDFLDIQGMQESK